MPQTRVRPRATSAYKHPMVRPLRACWKNKFKRVPSAVSRYLNTGLVAGSVAGSMAPRTGSYDVSQVTGVLPIAYSLLATRNGRDAPPFHHQPQKLRPET